MKKTFTLFILISSVVTFTQAQNATFGWSLAGGGATGADRSADVVTDASGNIFTANSFLNTAAFNGVTLTGSPKGTGASYDPSLFISKISPTKTTLWYLYSNIGTVSPTAVATTPAGDLIVTGTMRAIVGAPTTNANIIDAVGTITTFTGLSTTMVQSFVAKFNSSGVLQWVKEINSGAAKDKAITTSALASDAAGNIYLTGIYTNTIILPSASPTTLTSTNTTQAAFIAKLDGSTGNEVWHKTSTGGIVSEILPAITYGDDGSIYAAGDFKNNASPIAITIGGKSFTPSLGADLTLIKLDVDGNISYIQERPSLSTTSKDIRVKDITKKGTQVIIAGSFVGNDGGIQFSGGNLTSTTSSLNGFIAAFNISDGTNTWQKAVLSPAIAEINGISIGKNGNLYAFGYHYNKLGTGTAGPADFGNGFTLTDATNTLGDLFLSSYNVTTGVTQEVHLVGKGASSETSNSLCSFGNNLYLLGTTNSNPVTFENASTYATLGAFDFFLVNYSVPDPTVTPVLPSAIISGSSLTAMDYNLGSGPSTEKTFTISGTNLSSAILLMAPSNFEISTASGASFAAANQISIPQTAGVASEATIYVRLKAGLSANAYSSNIIVATSDLAPQYISCNGTVTDNVNLTVQIGSNGGATENNVALTNGSIIVVQRNNSKTITFVPTLGYEVATLTFNGVDVKSQIANNQYVATPANNSTLAVTFQKIQYLLSIKDANTGTIDLLCDYGATPSFKFTAMPGWTFNTVIYEGVDVTSSVVNGVYTVPAMTSSALLNVSFASIPSGAPQLINGQLKVFTTTDAIIVEGTTGGELVTLYNVSGVQLETIQSQGDRIVIPVQHDSVYLVKTASKTFKVVL